MVGGGSCISVVKHVHATLPKISRASALHGCEQIVGRPHATWTSRMQDDSRSSRICSRFKFVESLLDHSCTSENCRHSLATQVDNAKPPRKVQPTLPDRGSVFDYCFDLQNATWVPPLVSSIRSRRRRGEGGRRPRRNPSGRAD